MASNPVPRTHQVIPGAYVNIVLKADQPTGRQVRGTVQHVLTKGDHHRGIKVRLVDGRIGRVQSMASSDQSTQSSSTSTSTMTDGTDSNPTPGLYSTPLSAPESASTSGGRGYRPRYRDVRLDEPLDNAPEQIDLGAYIVPTKRKGKGKRRTDTSHTDDASAHQDDLSINHQQAGTDIVSATATCPVCENFEGDEAAVAHHVAEHFGS